MAKKRAPQSDMRELRIFVDGLNPQLIAKLCTIFITGNDIPVSVFRCVSEIDISTWDNLYTALIKHRGTSNEELLRRKRIIFRKELTDILRKKNINLDVEALKDRYFHCYSKQIITALRANFSNIEIADILKYEISHIERVIEIGAATGKIDEIATLLGNLQPYAKFAAEISILISKTKVKLNIRETPYDILKRKETEGQEKPVINTTLTPTNFERSNITTTKIHWQVLPAGEHPFERIALHFLQLQEKNKNIQYDMNRLEQVHALNPSTVYLGIDEFDGYAVFYFANPKIAILECPVVGNAIYVLKDDWRRLSRLTKRDLLENYRKDTTRIIHSGEWFTRLKQIILQK